MKNNWKTIVLMALNGSGVNESDALMQIRVIEPMMEEYIAEQKKELSNRKIYQCGYDDAKKEVLDLVEKEVDKQRVDYRSEYKDMDEIMKCIKQTEERTNNFLIDDISTIINNLRV